MMFLLGGLFPPITLYPSWLAWLGEASPFAAHLYWPASVTIAPSTSTIVRGLASQVVWIGILSAFAALIWRAGLRKILRGDLP